jgi:hypothetical protein
MQVDLATSCMRPGASDEGLAALKQAVLGALERSSGKVYALCGTWQHDLDQVNMLPGNKVGGPHDKTPSSRSDSRMALSHT